MNRARLSAALLSFSLISSGCCMIQTRKDTGDLYVPPVSQWTWTDWGCVLLIGCAAYYVSTHHASENQMRMSDMPPREACDLTNPEFPVC